MSEPSHLGALVVDEFAFPVVGVRLRRGGFEITAEITGPARAGSSDRYTLHDEDGAVIYRRASGGGAITWPAVAVGVRLTFDVLLVIADRIATPGTISVSVPWVNPPGVSGPWRTS